MKSRRQGAKRPFSRYGNRARISGEIKRWAWRVRLTYQRPRRGYAERR